MAVGWDRRWTSYRDATEEGGWWDMDALDEGLREVTLIL
jgi:hypothetical protein